MLFVTKFLIWPHCESGLTLKFQNFTTRNKIKKLKLIFIFAKDVFSQRHMIYYFQYQITLLHFPFTYSLGRGGRFLVQCASTWVNAYYAYICITILLRSQLYLFVLRNEVNSLSGSTACCTPAIAPALESSAVTNLVPVALLPSVFHQHLWNLWQFSSC